MVISIFSPPNLYSNEDLNDLKYVFKEFENVEWEFTGPYLSNIDFYIVIAFTFGTFFGGFINKLGSDTYDIFKRKLSKIIFKPFIKKLHEKKCNSGKLIFRINKNNTFKEIECIFQNEDDIIKFFKCISNKAQNIKVAFDTNIKSEKINNIKK